MIATHNMKVNGRWIAAGEEYELSEEKEPEKKPADKEKQEKIPKEDPKPRTTRKRKTGE